MTINSSFLSDDQFHLPSVYTTFLSSTSPRKTCGGGTKCLLVGFFCSICLNINLLWMASIWRCERYSDDTKHTQEQYSVLSIQISAKAHFDLKWRVGLSLGSVHSAPQERNIRSRNPSPVRSQLLSCQDSANLVAEEARGFGGIWSWLYLSTMVRLGLQFWKLWYANWEKELNSTELLEVGGTLVVDLCSDWQKVEMFSRLTDTRQLSKCGAAKQIKSQKC